MKRTIFSILLIASVVITNAQVKDKDTQIRHALMVVPDGFKDGAKVYGFDSEGSFVTLRAGTNDMICIADDPNKDGFSVAAYHSSLDEFMARGRELKAEGKGFKEIFDTRENEVVSGKLKMPDKSLLYVMTGSWDANGEPVDTYTRFVFYIPFATPESTGLPSGSVGPGSPWIMDPGTHRAHIMINPPKN